jgi:serine/threonine protein kinase
MESERWERIKLLCLGALERDESERTRYLDEVCGDDEPLRLELKSLLSYREESKDFLESPPLEFDVRLLPTYQAAFDPPQDADTLTGREVSHYRVFEKLGAGGMGVVYKAEDTKLGRLVALKFFPAVAPGSGSLQIVDREARALSALDHPNICTVYEVDEHEGSPFIAMQYFSGETLKQEIDGKPQHIEHYCEHSKNTN